MKKIAIIGSGHLGQQITHHIQTDTQDKVVAFFDDYQEKGSSILNIPILGGNSDIYNAFSENIFDELIIAIGYKHMNIRAQIFEKFSTQIPFYNFIHSSVILDKTTKLGQGSIIYPGCVIDQYVNIGNNVLLNISCSIAHDSTIGNHSFISPSVAIAGFVNIGEQSIIGINSTIIDNIYISPKTQLGAGTVVIKNIESHGLYVGNPAKFIR